MRIGNAGYRDAGLGAVLSSGAARELTDIGRIPIVRTQVEMVRLYSRRTGHEFIHDIELDLVAGVTPEYPDVGLLGASPTSHFARAAGMFSYQPHNDDAGAIVIGDQSLICPSLLGELLLVAVCFTILIGWLIQERLDITCPLKPLISSGSSYSLLGLM